MTLLSGILSWLLGLILSDVAVPVTEDVLSGKIAPAPSTITNAPVQSQVTAELQNDLDSQIAASNGQAPN